MTKKQVLITDKHELQNLLDDYSTDRPYLNMYDCDGGVFADEDELKAWRAKGQILTRAKARAADEPRADPTPLDPTNHFFRICLNGHVPYSISFDGCPSCKVEVMRSAQQLNRKAEPT